MQGKYPKKLSHHAGVLQPSLKMFIIYGGIVGIDSSDIIYTLDLNTFTMAAVLSSQQKEKNGKALPGPRDDFCFVTASNADQKEIRSTYLIGGFRNGSKMNDIYKLHILDHG